MPNVKDTPEYRAFRKEQLYGEALAESLRDGSVTPIEGAILDRLLAALEMDPDVARKPEETLSAQQSSANVCQAQASSKRDREA